MDLRRNTAANTMEPIQPNALPVADPGITWVPADESMAALVAATGLVSHDPDLRGRTVDAVMLRSAMGGLIAGYGAPPSDLHHLLEALGELLAGAERGLDPRSAPVLAPLAGQTKTGQLANERVARTEETPAPRWCAPRRWQE